jgi:hypothetical protein
MSAAAVTAFVLGIMAIILSWIPIINNISGFALAPLAVIFGIVALFTTRKRRRRGLGLAIAAIVMGIGAFIIVLLTQQAFSSALDDAFDAGVSEGAAAGTADDPLPYGQPVVFKSGVELTVAAPSEFTPSDSAYFDDVASPTFFVTDITVTNVSDGDKSLLGTIEGWLDGVADGQCSRVFDSGNLSGDIDGSLPAGRSKTQQVAFACPGSGSLQVFMTPDLFTQKVWFAAR